MRWSRSRPRAAGALLAALLLSPAAAADPPVVSAAPPAAFEDALPVGPSLEARLAEIRRRVQAALVYPPVARLREQGGEVIVSFEIGPDRRARGIRTRVSSGRASLDRAAERAVRRAGELPWVYGRIEVPVRFALVPSRR